MSIKSPHNKSYKELTCDCAGDGRVDDLDLAGVNGHVGVCTSGVSNAGIVDVDLRRILSHSVFWMRGDCGRGEEFVVSDLIGFGNAVSRSPKILFDQGVVLAVAFNDFSGHLIFGS